MGGAVCVRACPLLQQKGYIIGGVAVLDVVEGKSSHAWLGLLFDKRLAGSALDALPIMTSLLDSRPDGFDSIEEAIQWQ